MSLDPDAQRKILQCVNDALETLGKSGKQALSHYLEKDVDLKIEEIPQKPDLFRKGLNLIFGEQGADALETAIVQRLMASLGLDPKPKLTLAEAINIIKAAQEKSP